MFVPIFLVLAVVVTRLLPLFGDHAGLVIVANFSPMLALVVCGAAYFSKGWALLLPLAGYVISDLILNAALGVPLVGLHFALMLPLYAVVAFAGWKARDAKNRAPLLLGTTLLGVLAFHIVSNTGAFIVVAGYEKSLAGWFQSQTMGLPGFPPTWVFLVKSLVGNLAFAGIFCLIFEQWRSVERLASPADSAVGS